MPISGNELVMPRDVLLTMELKEVVTFIFPILPKAGSEGSLQPSFDSSTQSHLFFVQFYMLCPNPSTAPPLFERLMSMEEVDQI